MGLIVKHADGSDFLNIENKTYDDVSTSLKLPGKGVLNWGEAYVNNFTHLLENFASSTEPRNPQVGQVWYNTGNGSLSVYTITHEWEILNKDADIEEKFDTLIDNLKGNYAADVPPSDPLTGQMWFDTSTGVLKVFTGTEWVSFGINSIATYIQPSDPHKSDLWYDKNVDSLKVFDGNTFQRIISTIESATQPIDVSAGQWWANTTTGQMFVYTLDPASGEYYWNEIGTSDVTEGATPPTLANEGALHIVRSADGNSIFINKGTKSAPIWAVIQEFGGAIKSITEPLNVVDGMLWLDGDDVLKIMKAGVWIDIDESAISFVSSTEPTSPKDGFVWFNTSTGSMVVMVNDSWEPIQNIGLVHYGIAPSSPTTGQLWYDNTNGELKIWDGSVWNKVNSSATIVSYVTPVGVDNGQLWLDTIAGELKVKTDGRWASLPEKARAFLSLPANPRNGDMAYVEGNLKIWDGTEWRVINININNSVSGSSSINYDADSHEIVIVTGGIVTRVPLAVKRDVIIENVGITDELVEVIYPDILEGEKRIIDIHRVNLGGQFFVFKNGLFTDNWTVEDQDLILHSASGTDEIDIVQFNGGVSINYLVKKFTSSVSGNFTINNYTRTTDEQFEYDIIKREFDLKKSELIEAHASDDLISDEDDLTDDDWVILDAIKVRFPVKESNEIADLSLGAIMVFKEGVFIPTADLSLNVNNENNIVIPNCNVGEHFTITQLIVGTDYKAAFFSKEYMLTIGAVTDDTESTLRSDGRIMDDMINTVSNSETVNYGAVEVNYTYDATAKVVTFDLIDIDPAYHFFVTRNNLFVSPTNYVVDTVENTLTMSANTIDDIRFFQFYLPHNYAPVEFNFKHGLAAADGWITLELNRDFDLFSPLMVYRNGALQSVENINIIRQETLTDDDGFDYTVNGLRKVQVFGDTESNNESISGIRVGDSVTIMQVSQPDIYHQFLEEFGATVDGMNIFTFDDIDPERDMLVYRNGLKLDEVTDEFHINTDGRLVVNDCNGPTVEELSLHSDARGDLISVYQFYTKDTIAENDLSVTLETIVATQTGSENFQLQDTHFVQDEYLLVFKNGQLITRRQAENQNTTQSQINKFNVFTDRVFHGTTPALDPIGNPIIDADGNHVINVDPDDFTDVTAFSLDNVVEGESIEIYEYNKRVTDVNNLTSETHFEVLPENNIQRIYTTKFDQLSNLTMMFQDGLLIDRTLDGSGDDTVRLNGMLRVLDQYAVDNNTVSVIVDDWVVGGKLRVQQLTANQSDIRTVTLTIVVAVEGTFDVFLPNNEIYTPNTGALEVYVDRTIQWSDDDYFEVANNRILFNSQLSIGQVIKIIVRQ